MVVMEWVDRIVSYPVAGIRLVVVIFFKSTKCNEVMRNK
jgi:hypothetical protein